jgi:hypothetical protein
MTNILISCPSCPQKLRVPEELLGRPVKCPKCGMIFDAPSHAGDTDPAGVPGSPPGEPPPSGLTPGEQPAATNSGPSRRIRRDAEPGRGALILTLGIVSILLPVIGWIPGILAIALGRSDQRKIRAGLMDASAADTTQAGWICGIIGTIIQALVCVACGLYMSVVFWFVTQATKNPNFLKPPPPNAPFNAPKGPGIPPPPGKA